MKKLELVLSLVAAAVPVSAGISSGSGGATIVVAVPEPRTVAVCKLMPAELVSVPLRVISDQKASAFAYEETRQALDMISRKVKENGQFRTSAGVVSLSRHKGGFGISSGSWQHPAAAAEIYLLVPLTKERDNIFTAGAEAARFVEGLRLPGRARCELGQLQLAVENPEQYRTNLLGEIAQEIKRTRAAMTAEGSVRVDGLEGSVLVRQADNRQVELFLNYTLSVTLDK